MIERRKIFKDKDNFLDRLGILLPETKITCYVWALLLSFFGHSLRESLKRYVQYVEFGIEQGRRPELVGGGLIRSPGGFGKPSRHDRSRGRVCSANR